MRDFPWVDQDECWVEQMYFRVNQMSLHSVLCIEGYDQQLRQHEYLFCFLSAYTALHCFSESSLFRVPTVHMMMSVTKKRSMMMAPRPTMAASSGWSSKYSFRLRSPVELDSSGSAAWARTDEEVSMSRCKVHMDRHTTGMDIICNMMNSGRPSLGDVRQM